ncbi:MAG: ATP synthase F1 subunit gamma [Candidatus Amoebophilus sp. 36-38]|nr:MAG: ATP synthase F1 subunit gamma [Candidatus Amoebophilus sp. 36-38]
MPNIKEIVSRIHSVNSTQQITKAMKMVAAAKLIKVQHQLLQLRPYADKLSGILHQVVCSTENGLTRHYTEKRTVKKLLLVVMTSDKGLCGSFNANILKKTEAYINQFSDLTPEQIDILVIGKKAFTFFQKRDYNLIPTYTSLSTQLRFEMASQAADLMIEAFLNHTYDQVELIYNLFGSAASQFVQTEPFLPIVHPTSLSAHHFVNYIYEPSKAVLIENLIPMALKIQFYKALLESSASEHGARMTTMSKATDNANALLKTLRITYNKTRQAAITNEILEIAAGAEALAH